MISKCSSVILERTKFSEFEDACIDGSDIYVSGYQTIDDEKVNVKLNINEFVCTKIAESITEDKACVINVLKSEMCLDYLGNVQDGVDYIACAGCWSFDVSKTGYYIQINEIADSSGEKGWLQDPYKMNTSYVCFSFKNLPLGKKVHLYLPNFGANKYIGEDSIVEVRLMQLGLDQALIAHPTLDCPMCGDKQRTQVILSVGGPVDEEEKDDGTAGDDKTDYLIDFIQVLNAEGTLKYTRKVSLTNIYDGLDKDYDQN